MLQDEFKYYLDNQIELVNKYFNKFLIIKDKTVVEFYDTKREAYNAATAKYDLGTFIIQHCLPGTQSHTQIFHSQVMFKTTAH